MARFVLDETMWKLITPLFFQKWEELKPRGLSTEKSLKKAVCYLKEIWFEDKNVRNWFQGALPLGPITNISQYFLFKPTLLKMETLLFPTYL